MRAGVLWDVPLTRGTLVPSRTGICYHSLYGLSEQSQAFQACRCAFLGILTPDHTRCWGSARTDAPLWRVTLDRVYLRKLNPSNPLCGLTIARSWFDSRAIKIQAVACLLLLLSFAGAHRAARPSGFIRSSNAAGPFSARWRTLLNLRLNAGERLTLRPNSSARRVAAASRTLDNARRCANAIET